MSLYIDIDNVTHMLLATGWYEVTEDSFNLDAYEFHDLRELLVGGGTVDGVPATGFTFTTVIDGGRTVMSGPLTAILAVREPPSDDS